MKNVHATLKSVDPEISGYIDGEVRRQADCLLMIPSENYASTAVRQAVGSVLINKYAEGQVGKRYYQGNAFVDAVERIAKERVLQAFGLEPAEYRANVQPHSGCPANLAVYNGLLTPGDRIMAMYLPDGGHLSHGWEMPGKKVTLVSKIWNVTFYHVDEKTKVFDYSAIEKQARSVKPRLLISGGTAYAREIDHKRMAAIAKQVGAYYLADVSHEAGLIAGGANRSPFPYADVVTFTTHKTFRGPRGAVIVGRTNLMDLIDASVFPGLQGGPHEHTIAGIAVALREMMRPSFRTYARQVVKNAQVLADEFTKAGYDVVSGGTDKHLVLLDLRKSQISAWVAAWALEYAGIVLNRNTVPYDTGSPYYPSGIRMGTPAITTRGMKEREMRRIAAWILEVFALVKPFRIPEDAIERKAFLSSIHRDLKAIKRLGTIASEVKSLAKQYPVP